MTEKEVQEMQSDIESLEKELERIDGSLDELLRRKTVIEATIVVRKAQAAPIRSLLSEILSEMIL